MEHCAKSPPVPSIRGTWKRATQTSADLQELAYIQWDVCGWRVVVRVHSSEL